MAIGHDVVITTNKKQRSYSYYYLINYIGMSYNKENLNDNNYKNGLRIIQKNCNGIKRSRVRKWARSRFYYGRQAIVMDNDISNSIFKALLKALFDIPGQNNRIKTLLSNVFASSYGDKSYCFAVLQEIYTIILQDSLNNNASATFINNLKNIEKDYPH